MNFYKVHVGAYYTAEVTVEADSRAEAVEKAKELRADLDLEFADWLGCDVEPIPNRGRTIIELPTADPQTKAIFDRNFDKESFIAVRDSVQDALDKNYPIMDLFKVLDGYDLECDDEESDSHFRVERELDRSRMETTADYVSVEFEITYSDKTKKAEIDDVTLYTSEDDIGLLCSFNKDTFVAYKY